ncbi:MAG: polyprenyl synthetase family protein [Candidatus Zixiibacteriota bacterium]|nr:MAG: polyprenyl synthetase family protein [candidate division Zixibacteria bacterium]
MDTPHFLDLFREFKQKVDEYIFNKLPINHDIPEIELLYEMMRDYPSRSGKGLRPGLLMTFNRAFGGSDEKSLNTAAALEIFQNWIVIHDDIEDGSDLRRGQPALHVKFGMPLALNAGDALAGKMWELIYENKNILGNETAMKVFNEFLIMYSKTTEGQHIELGWERNRKWDLTADDYFCMCKRKTAWYTCISPSWIGGLIAGAGQNLKDAFIQFGEDLGVAFQLQDDILNLVGDRKKYGKEIGGDILEGKRTLMLIDLMTKCTKNEKRFVIDSLDRAREKKDPRIINDILEMTNKYGSIDYAISISKEKARNSRRTYLDQIDGNIVNDEYQKVIIDLIDFMVEREF